MSVSLSPLIAPRSKAQLHSPDPRLEQSRGALLADTEALGGEAGRKERMLSATRAAWREEGGPVRRSCAQFPELHGVGM